MDGSGMIKPYVMCDMWRNTCDVTLVTYEVQWRTKAQRIQGQTMGKMNTGRSEHAMQWPAVTSSDQWCVRPEEAALATVNIIRLTS